jgi:hypothetical protein
LNARGLVADHNHEGLPELKVDLYAQIEEVKQQHGIDSSTSLREQATETGTAAETMDCIEATSDWELTRCDLSMVKMQLTTTPSTQRSLEALPSSNIYCRWRL